MNSTPPAPRGAREPVTLQSPAKVNWILRVGARRTDGFHGVHTALIALELHDTLTAGIDPDLAPWEWSLQIEGPAASVDIPTDGRNLIGQALAALPEAVQASVRDLPGGLAFQLHKRIPSQAGLGGGSSNAAAALAALWRLADLPRMPDLWLPALDAVGSDCAFFGRLLMEPEAVATPSAWYTDRGQAFVSELMGLSRETRISVITPDAHASTGAVYGAFDAPAAGLAEAGPAPVDWLARRQNDLHGAALAVEPRLAEWGQVLESLAPGAYQLSGSGASFYAPCPAAGEAGAAGNQTSNFRAESDSTGAAWHASVIAALAERGFQPRFDWCGPLFRVGR